MLCRRPNGMVYLYIRLSYWSWRINSSGGYGTNASITGGYASIDYGSQSCVQDISFSTLEFTPSKDLINISFDWAFQDYTGSSLIIRYVIRGKV